MRAEVSHRIKRDGGIHFATHGIVAVALAADGEERPSRRVGNRTAVAAADAGRVGLQEVDVAERDMCGDAGEDDEELHNNAAGEDEDGEGGEDGAHGHCCRCMRMRLRFGEVEYLLSNCQ